MRKMRKALGVGIALGAVAAGMSSPANAVTTVNLGTVSQFSGPGGLDLSGKFVYAINFSANDPDLAVNGVTFLHDRQVIPGASLTGPQNVAGWQTKPEYGGTADDNNLEQMMHDIRWANTGGGEILAANLNVVAGVDYKLQILISGNHAGDNRRWDILVDGLQAVDEITSLGSDPGQSYNIARSTVYTYQFKAPDNQLNIIMTGGPGGFGANDGGDRNPIWQALTLEQIIPEPATAALLAFGSMLLFRRRGNPANV